MPNNLFAGSYYNIAITTPLLSPTMDPSLDKRRPRFCTRPRGHAQCGKHEDDGCGAPIVHLCIHLKGYW